MMFRGINAIQIDSKGRLAIPTRYRERLSGNPASLVVTIDTEETCLLIYPTQEWQLIENKLQTMPSFDARSRRIQRLLIGHATDIELDAQGRFVLPPILRQYACLDKSVVMIGQSNKFELWDEALWQSKRDEWLKLESKFSDDLPNEMKNFSL